MNRLAYLLFYMNRLAYLGGRHSTEEALALPTQPSRVPFSAPLSEWTAIKRKRSKKKFKKQASLLITAAVMNW